LVSILFLVSCAKEYTVNTVEYSTEFDKRTVRLDYGHEGGRDTVAVPFDSCYIHYVRNNHDVLFFYLKDCSYAALEKKIERHSIIVEPKEIDPDKGFSYLEWDWFAVELKDNKVYICVKENTADSVRSANILLPRMSRGDGGMKNLDIRITQGSSNDSL